MYNANNPRTADTKEDIRIAAFPVSTILGSENAKLSINIDIVKPIPAIIPTVSPGINSIRWRELTPFLGGTDRLAKIFIIFEKFTGFSVIE